MTGFIHPGDEIGKVEMNEFSAANLRESMDLLLSDARQMIAECSEDNPPFLLALVGTHEGDGGTIYTIHDKGMTDKVKGQLLLAMHNYIHKHRMESRPSEIHPENTSDGIIRPEHVIDKTAVKVYD